jgi:hypothetical protein
MTCVSVTWRACDDVESELRIDEGTSVLGPGEFRLDPLRILETLAGKLYRGTWKPSLPFEREVADWGCRVPNEGDAYPDDDDRRSGDVEPGE